MSEPRGEWSRSSAREPNLLVNLALPMGQASFTGILFFFLGLSACLWGGVPVVKAVFGGVFTGAAAAVVFWCVSLNITWNTLWVYEHYLPSGGDRVKALPAPDGGDDEDVIEGDEMPSTPVMRLQVVIPREESTNTRVLDLHIDPDRLRQFAQGVQAGRSLSEREWAGQGRLFTVAEFRALRAELQEREFIDWRSPGSPGQGVKLTDLGEALVEQLARPVQLVV